MWFVGCFVIFNPPKASASAAESLQLSIFSISAGLALGFLESLHCVEETGEGSFGVWSGRGVCHGATSFRGVLLGFCLYGIAQGAVAGF